MGGGNGEKVAVGMKEKGKKREFNKEAERKSEEGKGFGERGGGEKICYQSLYGLFPWRKLADTVQNRLEVTAKYRGICEADPYDAEGVCFNWGNLKIWKIMYFLLFFGHFLGSEQGLYKLSFFWSILCHFRGHFLVIF